MTPPLLTRPISALAPATSVARFAVALARSKGIPSDARDFAEQHWRDSPQVAAAFALLGKATVPAATASHATWAGPLAAAGIAQEAIEWQRGRSIAGALEPRTRKVPFATNIPRQTTGGTGGGRVPEGGAVKTVSWAYDFVRVDVAKVQTLIVVAIELLRAGAEPTLRASLLGSNVETIDRLLLGPTEVGSLTNGAIAITSTGSTPAAIVADLTSMIAAITTSGAGLVWIMRPTTAARVAQALGSASDLPRSLYGLPIILSPTSPRQIALVDGGEILWADDGDFEIDLARDAAIQMDDAPTNASAPAPVSTSLVSMFESNSVAFRVSRWVNWLRLQPGAVVYMVTSY